MSILDASIPPKAHVAEPLSIAEIDAHPDAVRIWATIEHVRNEAREEALAEMIEGEEE